jgi:hypothetical protein
MSIDQFIDDKVLGLFLRLMLPLTLDALADGVAELFEIAVIAEILRELIVQLGSSLRRRPFKVARNLTRLPARRSEP